MIQLLEKQTPEKPNTSTLPKPPTWRLYVSEHASIYFRSQPPRPRRRRALKRWFGWRVQLRQINGEYVDL
jgi:hypothetical protein